LKYMRHFDNLLDILEPLLLKSQDSPHSKLNDCNYILE
jgi:hypothetical protein